MNNITKPTIDPLLSVNQAAEVLAVHPQTVRKMVYRRELTCSRRGAKGHIKLRLSELQRWIRANEVQRLKTPAEVA